MYCVVLSSSSFAPWLLCAGEGVHLFSYISSPASLTWRQLTAVRSCYEGELQRLQDLPHLLQRHLQDFFKMDLLSILPLWGPITHFIMYWAVASFRAFNSTVEMSHVFHCQIVNFGASSEAACTIHLNQTNRERKQYPELCLLSAPWASLNSVGRMKSPASLHF